MGRRAWVQTAALTVMLVVFTSMVISTCLGNDAAPASPVPVDADGFPIDWPIAPPPGTVTGCDAGAVSQEDSFFSVVLCLPDDADPQVVSEQYLAVLESDGFVQRDPGAFRAERESFLDGNGIEIYFQLRDDIATIVLIKTPS